MTTPFKETSLASMPTQLFERKFERILMILSKIKIAFFELSPLKIYWKYSKQYTCSYFTGIFMVYLVSPTLGRDTAPARGANYCGPIRVPSPMRDVPHSLRTVYGFFNVPQNLYLTRRGLRDRAYGLSSLSEKTRRKSLKVC